MECVRRGFGSVDTKVGSIWVPQGSVLGPYCSSYILPASVASLGGGLVTPLAGLTDLIEGYGLPRHLYADDTRLSPYVCRPAPVHPISLP